MDTPHWYTTRTTGTTKKMGCHPPQTKNNDQQKKHPPHFKKKPPPMPRPPRTCLTCGALHHNTSRCDQCETQRETQRLRHRDKTHYDHTYRKAAKQVRDSATICWICKQPAKPNDPWTADHLIPADLHSPLLPAHRSCNSARGNRTHRDNQQP